jgi:hypothetical protein
LSYLGLENVLKADGTRDSVEVTPISLANEKKRQDDGLAPTVDDRLMLTTAGGGTKINFGNRGRR